MGFRTISVEEAAAKHGVRVEELIEAVWTDRHEGPIGFQREGGLHVLDDDNLKAWSEASRTYRNSRMSTDCN